MRIQHTNKMNVCFVCNTAVYCCKCTNKDLFQVVKCAFFCARAPEIPLYGANITLLYLLMQYKSIENLNYVLKLMIQCVITYQTGLTALYLYAIVGEFSRLVVDVVQKIMIVHINYACSRSVSMTKSLCHESGCGLNT